MHQNHYIRSCKKQKVAVEELVVSSQGIAKVVKNSKKKKTKLYGPLFMDGGSTASRLEPLRGGSLIFTTKFPEIPGTHFIDLGRMKG